MNERYSRDLRRGLEFQDHIMCVLYRRLGITLMNFSHPANQAAAGENINRIEIKLDAEYPATGNLFIEFLERPSTQDEWAPSGIDHPSKPWLLVIGNKDKIFLIGVRHLRREWRSKKYHETNNKGDTAFGFLLPVEVAEELAVLILAKSVPVQVPPPTFSNGDGDEDQIPF